MDSGKITKIVSAQDGLGRGVSASSWSPDNKWVTYSMETPAKVGRVYVYSLEQGKSFPVTDGLNEATSPAFDAGGKYLYFLSSSDTGMSKHGFSQSASDVRAPRFSVYMAVLQKDVPSPFLRESDEEKGPMPTTPFPGRRPTIDDEKKEEPKKTEPKKDEPKKDAPKPDEEPKKTEPKPANQFRIDFPGIDQRIIALPMPAGSYGNLQAGAANQVFVLSRPEGGGRGEGGPGGGTLMKFDVEARRVSTVQAGVGSYELTPDGRKMLYSQAGDWYITSTAGGGAAPTAVPSFGGRGSGGAVARGRRGWWGRRAEAEPRRH